jgi:CBS domain-containing protein
MTPEPVTVEGTETYDLCLQKMSQINSRHMPVCEKGKLIGMISIRDLLNEHLIQKEDEINIMSAYIQDVSPSQKKK